MNNFVKKLTSVRILAIVNFTILFFSFFSLIFYVFNYYKTEDFNKKIMQDENLSSYKQTFEARFASAYWLAKKEMYKESSILFNNLIAEANDEQKAAIHYNIGNIFFKKGLIINGTNMTVRDEAEYLFQQAKKSYQASLKLSNQHWDARHNLDRILTMLPPDPTPGVGDSDAPGLIMGNIPIGLP
jgi:mxaK protein